MDLKDIFKKKPRKVPSEPRGKKPEERTVEVKPQQIPKEVVFPKKERKQVPGLAYQILDTPHVSEKATFLSEKNKYVFKVWPKVNKTEIKKAIEGQYGVNVLSVKIIKVLPKKRRLGKTRGWRKGYKKAIVAIKEGQKIEVLPR